MLQQVCMVEIFQERRNLLQKQKKGKKRMKQFGKVSLPSEAFVNLLKK
jgi:GTP-binding protein LepA